jgi:hypothetical protein
MPLYRVERQLGTMSPADLDAAAFRSIACVPHFTGMAWLRSFFDPAREHMTCYYVALNADDIRRHAQMAAIPCDEIAEVHEYLPDAYR